MVTPLLASQPNSPFGLPKWCLTRIFARARLAEQLDFGRTRAGRNTTYGYLRLTTSEVLLMDRPYAGDGQMRGNISSCKSGRQSNRQARIIKATRTALKRKRCPIAVIKSTVARRTVMRTY